MASRFPWLAAAFAALIVASAQMPLMAESPGGSQIKTTHGQLAAAEPDVRATVPNFGIVSPVLLRGAQPREGGLESLKKAGVKTIVNLRDGKKDIAEEQALAESLGLNFVSIPMSALKTAKPEQTTKFLETVRNPAMQPVFVHCRQGQDRCGTMVAMYRIAEQGWTPERAYKEMLSYGFHPIFLGLTSSVFAAAGNFRQQDVPEVAKQ